MKKITYFFVLVFLITTAQITYGCSPSVGFTYPNLDAVLSQDNTAIAVYEISIKGPSSSGILIIGNENSIMNMNFDLDKTSCSTRSDDFTKNEYIVAVFNKNDTKIHHTELDSQFSYSFSSKSEAFKKFNTLSAVWSKRDKMDNYENNKNIYYHPSKNTLKPNMIGDEISNLQNALKVKLGLGDDFKIDGSYGPATIKAVKQFQKNEGIKDDGIAGSLTQKKLETVALNLLKENNESLTLVYKISAYTLKPGMKNSNDVESLQLALKSNLDLKDDFKIDGSYGPATIKAVKQFQKNEGIKDDGIAGPVTQKILSGRKESMTSQKNENSNVSTKSNDIDKDSQKLANNDIFDGEIKKILVRAKNEFINKSFAGQNYNEAYSLVVKYNNEILAVTDASDPLYKSSGGGKYFVYFAQLSNGKYACVDSNQLKEILENKAQPDTTLDQVTC